MNNYSKSVIISLTIMLLKIFIFVDAGQSQAVQKFNKDNEDLELSGYFSIGVNKLGISALNNNLASNDYSKYSPYLVSIGGGGFIGADGLQLGGEGYGFFDKHQNNNAGGQYKTSLDAGYGFFTIGYQSYWKNKFRICPILGLGGGGIKLKIIEKEKPSSFSEVLASPGRHTELLLSGLLLDFSIKSELLLRSSSRPTKMEIDGDYERFLITYLMIGIRMGYTIAPFKNNWEASGTEIPLSPDVGMLGPYIRITLGIGYKYFHIPSVRAKLVP